MTNNTFFTADLHICHTNIIKIRGFDNNDDYHNLLINNWNNKVDKNDLTYILGDVIWKSDGVEIIKQLNGRKRIIKGNHDHTPDLKHMKKQNIIEQFSDCEGVTIYDSVADKDRYIYLSHYPHRSWNRSYHGSLHFYGHIHNTIDDWGLSTDVGVDKWNHTPVSFDELMIYFKDRIDNFKKGDMK